MITVYNCHLDSNPLYDKDKSKYSTSSSLLDLILGRKNDFVYSYGAVTQMTGDERAIAYYTDMNRINDSILSKFKILMGLETYGMESTAKIVRDDGYPYILVSFTYNRHITRSVKWYPGYYLLYDDGHFNILKKDEFKSDYGITESVVITDRRIEEYPEDFKHSLINKIGSPNLEFYDSICME